MTRDPLEAYTAHPRRFGLDWNAIPFYALPLDRFDPADYVKKHADANAEAIFQYVKDCWGYCIYDTRVGRRLPQMKGDWLRQILDACHARGMQVMAYIGLNFDRVIFESHPEWKAISRDGSPLGVMDWTFACYNTGYRRYMLDLIEELVAGWDVDMMWLDIPVQGDLARDGCYCDGCQGAYRARFGAPIPREPDWSRKWKELVSWRLDVIDESVQQFIDTIHRFRPGIPVLRNGDWYGSMTTQRSHHLRGEEFTDTEDWRADSGATTFVGTWVRGMGGRRAFHGAINTDLGGVQEPASEYRYRYRALHVLTHGAAANLGDSCSGFMPDGSLDAETFHRVGAGFSAYKEREGFIRGASTVPFAGILYTDANRILHDQAKPYGDSLRSIDGVILHLMGLHVPVDLIREKDLEPGALSEFPLLVMPDTAALSSRQADAVRRYVQCGGELIATYESGLGDEMDEPCPDFQLADVFGLRFLGRSDRGVGQAAAPAVTYLRSDGRGVFKGLPERFFRVQTPFVQAGVTAGETLARVHAPAVVTLEGRLQSVNMIPGAETVYPAIHVNSFGKGRAIYVCAEIFRIVSYLQHCNGFRLQEQRNYWWINALVANMLDILGLTPPVRVQAPITVEATFWRSTEKRQLIVQLFNKTHFDVLIPIDDVSIVVRPERFAVRSARWVTGNQNLPLRRSAEGDCVTVPRMGLHEVVVLDL